MSLYYQEKIKLSKLPFIAALVIVAVVLLVISTTAKAIASMGYFKLVDGILLAMFVWAGYLLIHSSQKQIRYSLVQQELLIQEQNAGNMKIQSMVFLNQVRSFKPVNITEKMACVSTDATCLIHKAWKLTYEKNGKVRSLIMRPSEGLAKTIRRELEHLTVQ